MAKMNLTLAGTTFTDYLLANVGSGAFRLEHDYFTKQDLVIRTAASGGGTLLVEDTDYTLGGEDLYLSAQVTAAVGSGRNVFLTVTIINASYQTGNLYFSGKYVADAVEALDVEISRGGKIGLDIYYAGSDDVRIRPGVIDVAGLMVDVTAEYTFTGESGWSAAWQLVTINQAGTIQLRSGTGPNTARPTDAAFAWGEAGGSGFNHAKNGYYYGAYERIIGALWRVNATTYYLINLGSGADEAGENANGKYRKSSDGVLICSTRQTASGVAITTLAGGIYWANGLTWTYPHAFASDPSVQFYNINDTITNLTWYSGASCTTTTAMSHPLAATSHTATLVWSAVAVGRWKA